MAKGYRSHLWLCRYGQCYGRRGAALQLLQRRRPDLEPALRHPTLTISRLHLDTEDLSTGPRHSGNRYNLHALGRHRQRGCTTCHVAVPHGWTSRSLIADIQANPETPAPYFAWSRIRVYNWAQPAQWVEEDCGGCHDRNC